MRTRYRLIVRPEERLAECGDYEAARAVGLTWRLRTGDRQLAAGGAIMPGRRMGAQRSGCLWGC